LGINVIWIFFGAGNLIFPDTTWVNFAGSMRLEFGATLGFLITGIGFCLSWRGSLPIGL